ncbi:DUF4232 domain-containing protein [Streptomyces varsoviensis]|uniref:DUF4232 domain-containing protein n=1 Tax=Streptomyces varsoviensis TaxID=67373 RepID=UPI003400CA24
MNANTTARKARRRTLSVAAAAVTAAAALSLTACSGADSGTNAAGAGAQAADAAGSSGGAHGDERQASTGAKAGAGAQAMDQQPSGVHTARGGAKAGTGSRRCHTSGLKAAFATGEDAAPDPNASGATTTSVVVTNTSGRTCEIGGFPGVDLKPDAGGPAWSLARSSARHSSITLHPGDSTDFTINLGMAKENEEGSWKPATVAVTPPDETTALTLKWPWGPLVHQDGATHPATFVNPIG